MTTPEFPAGTILGYPRIGRRRELKKALEAYWSGESTRDELEAAAVSVRSATRARLASLGLGVRDSSIPSAFSFYDHVLDALVMLGALPERFTDLAAKNGSLDLDASFVLARGEGDRVPLEMTKWFDTNYHYLVPEIGAHTDIRFASDRIVREFIEARDEGYLTRPVVVGPVTFLVLTKAAAGAPAGFVPLDRIDDVVAVYSQVLSALHDAGAAWVQFDEPALVADTFDAPRETMIDAARSAYATLGDAVNRPAIFVTAPFGSLDDALPSLAESRVEAIGFDLVRGEAPTPTSTQSVRNRLANKVIVAGVIDGRNVWRGDLEGALGRAQALLAVSPRVSVSTSCSLQHVPHDVADEPDLTPELREWLAFADQKVAQVVTLARGLHHGREEIQRELSEASAAREARRTARGVRVVSVRDRVTSLTAAAFTRVSYDERRAAQSSARDVPLLPTTTIGSFPQTPQIRRARAQLRMGVLDEQGYVAAMRAEIERVIRLQEELGLDVLVHGEPERNDMVQYFAEHLDGFAVTANGWVQSYGSRCTRPSILWGDVSRPAPITVEWSRFAQSLTTKPVKGMLTGPVTILAWSFVRDDQPLADTARQVALALRDEIADLEEAGIGVVQVDEPALRELVPLTEAQRAQYLEWSIGAFRLATGGASPGTQVHTHLCYSEFATVIDAIRSLDADVTSIEAARSKMEIVEDIAASGFSHGIGPGVYDIHSPRVPSTVELSTQAALRAIPADRLWINPDCGLKTRGYDETIASLRNLVTATREARAALA